MSTGVFDLLLLAGLIGLASLLLFGTDMFRSIVLFIVFGLLMALAWARLNAPDLALAEAIVGAGVTGAMLIAAWHRMGTEIQEKDGLDTLAPLGVVGMAAVLVAVIWALIEIGGSGPSLHDEVMAHLPESGVRSPVTAVLLNFRGYDTLLELGVLLLAVASVQQLGAKIPRVGKRAGPALAAFAALLMPVLVLVSAYLLWRGSHAPGGAFQAGALLGAAGILMLMVEPERIGWLRDGPQRVALSIGPVVFMLVAMLALSAGHLLEYPRSWAGELILLVETMAMFSIAAALLALFIGAAEVNSNDKRRR